MLRMDNISVTLGKGSALERPVLRHMHLSVDPQEFVVIMGGNGAGKSTLFQVLSGHLSPEEGHVRIKGDDIARLSYRERASLVAQVMQDPRMGTMEELTISENMAFAFRRGQPRRWSWVHSSERKALFRKRLSLLGMGLEERLEERVANLSGGQRQALSLIMAFLREAPLILLDEITAALDPAAAETIMQLAAQLVQEEERTCLMVTHHIPHAVQY